MCSSVTCPFATNRIGLVPINHAFSFISIHFIGPNVYAHRHQTGIESCKIQRRYLYQRWMTKWSISHHAIQWHPQPTIDNPIHRYITVIHIHANVNSTMPKVCDRFHFALYIVSIRIGKVYTIRAFSGNVSVLALIWPKRIGNKELCDNCLVTNIESRLFYWISHGNNSKEFHTYLVS